VGTHAVAGALAAAAFYLIATPIAILARALGVGRRAGTPVWHERGVADSSRHS